MTAPIGELVLSWSGSTLVARLSGEIDLSNAPAFEPRILAELEGAASLVIDLTAVDFFDSSGVRLLFNVTGAAEAGARRTAIAVRQGGSARAVLRICAFREELIHDSLDEALRATAPAP